MSEPNDPLSRSLTRFTTTVIERARQQDSRAWSILVRIAQPIVYRWCTEALSRAHDLESLCQEIFVSVHRSLARFDGRKVDFLKWLKAITRRRIVDYLRRREKHPEELREEDLDIRSAPEGPGGALSESVEPSDERLFLQGILESLRDDFDEKTWHAFQRYVVDEVPAAAVAEELGLKTASVYAAKSRILRKVREIHTRLQ